MKAILYVESQGGPIEDYGVRIEDRAYYVPVLQSAAQYCVKQIEEAGINDADEVSYFKDRLQSIEGFLDTYDPKVQDPTRHFDLTYPEATYVSKRVADQRHLAVEFGKVLAAKGIFSNNLDRNTHTREQYKDYRRERCVEVVREELGALAVAQMANEAPQSEEPTIVVTLQEAA